MVSPRSVSISPYLARRPSEVTRAPVSRWRRSAGKARRRSPRRVSIAVSTSPSSTGRNPRTGDKVFVAEKYVVTFKPGKEMEERVRELDRQAAAEASRLNAQNSDNSVAETAGVRPGYDAHERTG